MRGRTCADTSQHRWPRYQPGLEEHTGWKSRVGRTQNGVGIGANDASALISAAMELLSDADGHVTVCRCNGHLARAHTLSTAAPSSWRRLRAREVLNGHSRALCYLLASQIGPCLSWLGGTRQCAHGAHTASMLAAAHPVLQQYIAGQVTRTAARKAVVFCSWQ